MKKHCIKYKETISCVNCNGLYSTVSVVTCKDCGYEWMIDLLGRKDILKDLKRIRRKTNCDEIIAHRIAKRLIK